LTKISGKEGNNNKFRRNREKYFFCKKKVDKFFCVGRITPPPLVSILKLLGF
jgi:hypothetical protein